MVGGNQYAVGDFDGDGRQDIVLGNIGENFYSRPDLQDPVKLWINDFNNNGTMIRFLPVPLMDRIKRIFKT